MYPALAHKMLCIFIHFVVTFLCKLRHIFGMADQRAHASQHLSVFGCAVKAKVCVFHGEHN